MSSNRKKAVAFRHLSQEHLGSFEAVLRDKDYDIIYIDTPKEHIDRDLALEADILFILGGPLGVHVADLYPFLHEEMDIIKRRLDKDLPCFGICLGGQLMAHALGADVYLGHQGREVGWKPLHLHCNKDMICDFYCQDTAMMHWHSDTFDLPKGAKLLGSTDQYENQVFKIGKSYGFQCHPEVTDRQLKELTVLFVGHLTGANATIDLITFREQTQEYATRLKQQSRAFLGKWIDTLEADRMVFSI